jgi:hypothetical protein
MVSAIAMNKNARVTIRHPLLFMKATNLQPRLNMSTPNQLNFNPTFGLPVTASPANYPPPALNKLVIAKDVDLKHFKISEFQTLTHLTDIQLWYNAVHARGRIYCIYTSPWEAFDRSSHMVTMWSLAHLDLAILYKKDTMLTTLNTLLSSKVLFKGGCEYYNHQQHL